MCLDALLSLPHPSGAPLQNSLSLLFERIYTKQYRVKATVAVPDVSDMGVECLLPMTMSYLLLRSLEADHSSSVPGISGSKEAAGGGKKGDIIRLYAMRQGLTAFDYDDESSDTMKQLLIRCMVHPLFLRLSEGRRFLSFVLIGLGTDSARTNAEMMRMFHAAIKFQLPLAKASIIALYADVYVRAWRLCGDGAASASNAPGQQIASFESDIIQDIMHAAIHSAHPKTAGALSSLLSAAWHDPAQKKAPRVEEMLQRLYEPILWRAIKAANPMVRRHAVEIFIDVFPLVNPDPASGVASASSFASNDELLQYQFDALLALLTDDDLGIRVLAISGISKILATWWEMLPTAVSKNLVMKIARDMVRDAGAGAAAVRVAVFHGLAYILDNVLSHPLLKLVLPTLHESLFDASESVQLAFIDLLHVIKKIRGVKYYEVAPLEEVMKAIQTSRSTKVVSKLIALVLNSYFPSSKGMESVLTRCLTLLRSNPHVFTIIMYYLHQHTDTVSDERRVEFVQAMYRMIVSNVKSQREKLLSGRAAAEGKKKKSRTSDGHNADDVLFIDVDDISLYETLMSVLVVLYQNLSPSLLEDAEVDAGLVSCFNDGGLPLLLATIGTRSASIRMNLIHLSALLPDLCSPDLNEISLPHLLELTHTAPMAEYAPILECLVAWGRSEELLAHIHASLYLALTGGADFFRDGADSSAGQERMREFRDSYQAKQSQLLDAAHQKKKATRRQTAKTAAARKQQSTFDDSQTVLDPLMALRYLTYLFEHEKTRTSLLQEGVEWTTATEDASSSSSPSTGRIVGFLAEILSCLSTHLVPALRQFVDAALGVELERHQQETINFLAQAVQVDAKTNLHVHARLKLLAQRANQLALEAAEAEAEAAAAAAAAAVSASDDADVDTSLTAPPLVVKSVVSHIAMFPINFENMMEFTSYSLLPMWTSVVDADNDHSEEKTVKQEEPTQNDDTQARGKKKSKKGSSASPAAAVAPAVLELATLSDFFRSHLGFAAKFATEMITLGYFHPQCPMQHLHAWVDHFNQLKPSGSSRFGPHTTSFLSEFLPTCFKSFYQMSVVATTTHGFASKEDVSRVHPTDEGAITFYAYAAFWRELASLSTATDAFDGLVAANATIRNTVSEVTKLFQASARQLPRIAWMLLESVVDDVRYPHAALLPCTAVDSTAELRAFPLLVLTTMAKSPATLFALPRTIALLTEQLAAHLPTNEASIIERMGAAVSALASLAEVHVKMSKSQQGAHRGNRRAVGGMTKLGC